MNTRSLALLALALPLIAACSATSSNGADGSSESGSGGAGAGHSTVTGSGGGGGDVIGGQGGNAPLPEGIGNLIGKVVAPEGTIPIAGALVYLTKSKPAPRSSSVACDTCVKLPQGTAYTLAKPDGMFVLPYYSPGDYFLVTEKGHFRRIRPITLQEGDINVDQSFTRLPSKTDDALGDQVPKMAVRIGKWDAVQSTLYKLGIDKSAIDRYETTSIGQATDCAKSNPTYEFCPNKLFKDPAKLAKYQVIFSPCSDSDGTTCETYSEADDAAVQKNLQDWVAMGGRFYATDYNYEWTRRPWPGYIKWMGETSQTGSACNHGGVNGKAQIDDPDMQTWLAAQGKTSITLDDSWLGIDSVATQMGKDETGATVPIEPKVWVKSSAGYPATVSFQQGCGRVLYSAFHMRPRETNDPLSDQERTLLYVLLEVGVCIGEIEPPK